MIRFDNKRGRRPAMFLSIALLAVSLNSIALAQLPAEKVFPASTKGFISIKNLKNLGEQWKKTQIGTLMNDPIMAPFKKDLRQQLGKRMEDRFGFTFDEVRQIPSGEVAAGMIAIPGEVPGYVLTMDVSDRLQETKEYLDRLTAKLKSIDVQRSVEQYKEQEIIIFQFPAHAVPEKAKEDTSSKTRKAKPEAKPADRKAYYLLADKHLLISDQPHLIRLIFDRYRSPGNNALSDVDDFQVVMKKCGDDMPEGSDPLIRWYIEPLNYGESIRTLMKGPLAEKRKNRPSVFTVLKEQGFDAIRGIGGNVNIKAEDKEVVYRVFIYAKKPFRLAMRMLVFPDSTDFTLPAWLPPDLARCSMFYADPIAIFDNFGTLFDALVMQGETGVWNDIIEGLRDEPNGPQIDIREEIIVHLGNRILGMSQYTLPISPQSESIVIAVQLKEGKEDELKKALHKLLDDDTEMQTTDHKSYLIWHRVSPDDVILPNTSISGVPDLVSTPSIPAGSASTSEDRDGEKDAEPMFPEGGITVAKGHLFIGTNIDSLKGVLDRLDQDLPSIAGHAEYQKVDAVFTDLGIKTKPHFMQFFARTDATIQPTYELIRQNKMPQSQAILGKAINALFSDQSNQKGGSGIRQQSIDGSKLPEFDKVKQYFGPAGLFGASEENGYFFKGFLLEKKPERPETSSKEDKVKPEAVKVEPKADQPEPKDKDVEPKAE